MRIHTSFNNFSRGQIDHDMNGRYDLPIYSTGSDAMHNFFTNFKGNALYRTGLENMAVHEDCEMIEFKFNEEQSYICLFYNLKIKFLSFDSSGLFGFVQNGGSDLVVTTPYSLADCKQLTFSQNDDALYIAHNDHSPSKLVRTAADTFVFNSVPFIESPFDLTYDTAKAITAITKATNAQLTITGHLYVAGDRIKIDGVVGMVEINDYTVEVASVVDVNNITIYLDTTNFTTYTSGGSSYKTLTNDNPCAVSFYKGRLYWAGSTAKITTVWGSVAGLYESHAVGSPIDDDDAIELTPAEIAEKILWLFAGESSLVIGSNDGITTLNGGANQTPLTANSVEATLTTAIGADSTPPVAKDGLVFYVGRDSRRIYYFSYDLLSETYQSQDANFISYDITLGGLFKLKYKKDRDDLVFSVRDGELISMNFNKEEKVVAFHEHQTSGTIHTIAEITDNSGTELLMLLVERNSIFYIELLTTFVEFSRRSAFLTSSKDDDNEAYARKVSQELTECNYLDNSSKFDQIQLANNIVFDGSNTITATSSVFVSGDVGSHIVYRTTTGYESGRFEITGYTSGTVVTVDVLQTPTVNTFDNWYLTTDTLTGLSRFNGETVSVVSDGGYLGDFSVSGGEISINTNASVAYVGYKYTGFIKSFALGFVFKGRNTQGTVKTINRVGVRSVWSAGGNFGTDIYDLEPVQQLSDQDYNYLPPLPLDGTKFIDVSGDFEEDTYTYFVQNEPLPFTLTALLLEGSYTV